MALRAVVLLLLATAIRALILHKDVNEKQDSEYNVDLYNTDPWKVEINLDLPPEDRWNDIIHDHHAQLVDMAKQCDFIFDAYGRDRLNRWFEASHVPEVYKREMQGIVKTANTENVTYECLLMNQLFYETGFQRYDDKPQEMCSGVLAAMPNGTVIHGRNADWGHDHGSTAAGALDVTFTRGGKPLYKAAMNLAQVGIHSAMSMGGWSFEQNTRHEGLNPDTNLLWAEKGGEAFMFMTRQAFDEGLSYAEALERFASTKWNSPQYFIIAGAGPYEGAIITVDPALSYQNVEVLNPNTRRIMYQLNSDAWLKPSEDRDQTFLKFESSLEKHRVEINADTVWNLITTPPVYNDGNLYSFVAIPATGYWKHIVHPEGTLAESKAAKV
mmetsp:Transcript_114245/g.254978  ORF Transcript_114245/g.254978 Transcript_114245/m.254978 type:complete len:384 (+) Transcript_114245:53-1204(+)